MNSNERQTISLPGQDASAGLVATAAGSIRAVYAHGIEFIDQMSTIGGMFAGFVWTFALALLWLFFWSLTYLSSFHFMLVMPLLMAILCLGLGRADSVGYRYEPVLFNKALQKIHVFTDMGANWWEFWKPFGGTSFRIDTFDWACARGEVAEVLVMGGVGVPRKEYALTMAITDTPGSNTVVARFGVGFTMGYDGGATQIARWEHIRRYMRNEGPALGPGDSLYVDPSREHWVGAFTFGQPLLGPGSKIWWTGEGWHGAWFITIPVGLAFLFLLPLTMPFSLIRWMVQKLKPVPRWPAEILASVGGAVDPQLLACRPNAEREAANHDELAPVLSLSERRGGGKQRTRNAA